MNKDYELANDERDWLGMTPVGAEFGAEAESRNKHTSRLHGLITHEIRADGITERFKAFGFIRYERVDVISKLKLFGVTVFARVGDKIEFLGVQL